MRKRVLTIAAFAGLQLLGLTGIDSAQAQYTYNLNNQTFTGFNFVQPNLAGFTGTLTSVSVNVTLNASVAYTYADDICIYVDIAPLSTGGLLQVGGFSNLSAAQRYLWPNGASDVPGTTCIGTVTLTTPLVFTGTASDPVLWIGNGYGASGTSGTWTGSVTLNNLTPVTAGPTCTAPTLSATTVAAVCQGSANGSIDLSITGGSPTPLSILWSNGANTEDLSNVAAGTYTVTVTTAGGGCTTTGSYTVADGAIPVLWYADADGDGYGDADVSQSACSQPSGYVADATDCNDGDNSVNPGVASDACNGVDNDCDGSTDEDATFSNYYVDADGDGYGAGAATSSCSAISGSVTTDGDCNDGDNSVNPGVASDACNGVDNDCDGSTDEDATFSNYYVDFDGDGYGAGAATSSCSTISGSVTVDGDCDDLSASVNPGATEVCNSIDDNCDGSTDEGTTLVAGAISGTATGCVSVVAGSAAYSITALSNATTYSWTVPSGMTIVSGQGTNSILVSWTPGAVSNGLIGTITVTPSNACGAGTSSSLAVDLNYTQPVRPSSISGPVRLCAGDNVTYSVANVARATSYIWTLPNGMVIVSGGGTNVINVTVGASYTGGTISCSAANACGTGPDRLRNVTINTLGASASISGPPTGVCGANGVIYTAAAVLGATSYNWTVPAGATLVSGQGSNSITVNFSSPFAGGNITVAAVNGCGTGAARSITINGAPAQPGPVSGDVSICPGQTGAGYGVSTVTGASSYSWIVPAVTVLVSGQGTKDIVVNWGTVVVSGLNIGVTASNACGTSPSRTLGGISVSSVHCAPRFAQESITGTLTLFPNPATDRVQLEFNGATDQAYTLNIFDMAGKLVHTDGGIALEGRNTRMVDVAHLSSGMYLVELSSKSDKEVVRFTK